MGSNENMLLTIIVPCYNAEKYINRCISCLERLDDEVSILFVNDGSVDATKTMLESWVQNHNNASILNKNNGGYSSAINYGLDYCATEYVMFMGVDDEIKPDGIKTVCAHLKDNNPDILAFSTIKKYDDSDCSEREEKETLTHYSKPGFFCAEISDIWKQLKSDAWILFTRDTSRCFKMSIIGSQRYFGKFGISSDGCFSSIVACRSRSFEFLNEECYLWHLHKDSLSGRNKTVDRLKDEANVWADYFEEIRKTIGNRIIPDPIFCQALTYRNVVNELKICNEKKLYNKHNKNVKAITNWMRHNKGASIKYRLGVMFPETFQLISDVKKSLLNH